MYQLPSEVTGKIYQKVTSSSPQSRELKFINKEAISASRYQTHIKGRVPLKSLVIKNINGKIVPFYYNLKSLIGTVVVNSIEELEYVPMLIEKLNSVTIEYNGTSIEDTFSLIEDFVNSHCELITIYKDRVEYTIQRRNELIVAYIDRVAEFQSISDYLDGIDSLIVILINDDIYRVITLCNITILHLDGIDQDNVQEAFDTIETVYITSDFGYADIQTIQPLMNVTKVEFENILVSGEIYDGILLYEWFARVFPNAEISVFRFDADDIIVGDNVVEVSDTKRVTRLYKSDIGDLLLSDGSTARFPNLNDIYKISVTMNEYDESVKMIKTAIRSIRSLLIRIVDGNKEQLIDIFKYLQLLSNTIKNTLTVRVGNDNIFTAVLKEDKIFLTLYEVELSEEILDTSYIDPDKVVITWNYKHSVNNFIRNVGINKLHVYNIGSLVTSDIPDIIKTVYISVGIPRTSKVIYPHIENVILYHRSASPSILKQIFPNANFYYTDK